ncbi:MAG: M81 family metallopeptidase, partial [Planctomycetes bacterium]|nr:M81 family metallopeptidase [Planctomycetota bacterium]
MRIAVGGIEHESSNFSPTETPLESFFHNTRCASTEELRKRSGEANTIIDGFIKGLRDQGEELVPLIWSHAGSGAQPTLETHEAIKGHLLDALRLQLPVDGILLSLHGAYSVQGLDDGDGDILEDVRKMVGPDCPIIAVHDLHCNIGETMVRNATALIVEDTYPHTDMAERGEEAAEMMVRTVRGEVKPTMGWRSLPLFCAAAHMISAEEPMLSL